MSKPIKDENEELKELSKMEEEKAKLEGEKSNQQEPNIRNFHQEKINDKLKK